MSNFCRSGYVDPDSGTLLRCLYGSNHADEHCAPLYIHWHTDESGAEVLAAEREETEELRAALKEMYEWRYVKRDVKSQEELDAQRDAMYERARIALTAFQDRASEK